MLFSIVPPKILGVIPARFASTRFPGKPLVLLSGKTMLQHVWERATAAKLLNNLIIATDDDRIAQTAQGFGAQVQMTRADHPTGTDRVAEVAAATDADIIVNIQGDEPLIDPAAIDTAILALLDDPSCEMATLKKPISLPDEVFNPNIVKVVTRHDGRALYFSRAAIPFDRNGGNVNHYKHIGLYVYRRALLLAYSGLKRGPLEEAEKLEQLRALENGIPIQVAVTNYESVGVDAPEDLTKVEFLLNSNTLHHG